ncbi:MAG: CHAT domain-containing protein [Chitinophagaceae bacterium]
MGRFFLICLSFLLLGVVLRSQRKMPHQLNFLLQKANRLYTLHQPTPTDDSTALAIFLLLADQLPPGPYTDSLSADCMIKAANIHQGYQRYTDANLLYHRALSRAFNVRLIRYEAWLYLGSSHYFHNLIDSAQIYFEKAALLVNASGTETALYPELDRLYNSLGAIYFESANYSQAQNYFERARYFTNPTAPGYQEIITGIESNIANCYMKRARHDTALKILQQLIPVSSQREIIRQNMAHAWYELGVHDSAMAIYRQLKPLSGLSRVIALNNIGRIYMARGEWSKAEKVFDSSISENKRISPLIRNKEEALAYLYRCRLARQQGLIDEALDWVDEGIREIHLDFDRAGARDLPDDISRSVSPITLAQLLREKAELLLERFRKTGSRSDMEACLRAYRKSIQTARYIRISFDNDEAKLFFNEQQKSVFEDALNAAIEAGRYQLPYHNDFLYFLENYKGTVLHQHLQTIDLKSRLAIPDSVKNRESELKQLLSFYISRINRSFAPDEVGRLQQKMLDVQVNLSRLQKTYEGDATYQLYRFQEVQKEYTVETVQQKLPPATALLHFFEGDSAWYLMAISAQTAKSVMLRKSDTLIQTLNQFLTDLNDRTEGRRFGSQQNSFRLYQSFVEPLNEVLHEVERWAVIPDGKLFYLPFETLQHSAKPNSYLLDKKVISYHYSVELLLEQNQHHERRLDMMKGLGMAPFNDFGDLATAEDWQPLPYSDQEIASTFTSLKGSIATRRHFLDSAGEFETLHLATHASTGVEDGANFIQFFPGDSLAGRLYMSEIYQLDLRHTQLVILSACETGYGSQLAGEGLHSLSRAFLYAGARGIIATLWKTEDRVAAYLMQRFHYHRENGAEPALSLTLAKRDLVSDVSISARYKTPNFWANFVYIGQLDKSQNKHAATKLLFVLTFIALVTCGFLLVKRHRRVARLP